MDALQNKRPQERIRIPQETTVSIAVGPKVVRKCLRDAHLDVPPGLGGCTNEMFRLCLEDNDLFQWLHSASEDFASGVVPPTVGRALMLTAMTALMTEGSIWIATGLAFKKLVAKCLARQFGKEVPCQKKQARIV